MKRQHSSQQRRLDQAGFTVVELMIATLVFSMVLLVITYGILNFSHAYFSGVNSSTTQNTARNIVGTVAQAIEFSGKPVSPTVQTPAGPSFFCASDQVFWFNEGYPYDASGTINNSNLGLYMMPQTGGGCPDPASVPPSFTGGKELLPDNIRVTAFSVGSASTNLYKISIRLAFGDSDLLCDPTLPAATVGSCSGTTDFAAGSPVPGDQIACKSQVGSQFCSVAALTTTVGVRVGG